MPTNLTMPPWVKIDPVYSKFWRQTRVYDNNVLMLVCGSTGSCKSGSAVTMAWDLDIGVNNQRRFIIDCDAEGNPSPKCRVIHTPQDFMRLIQSNLPTGSVVIWDEIGIEQDSRDFWTLKNKFVKRTMQLFRDQNLILMMTVPDLKSVDIGIRRVQKYYLELHGPLASKKYASSTMFWVQTDPRQGKPYYKNPRFSLREDGVLRKGTWCKLTEYLIRKPPLHLEVPYKKIKQKMAARWYKQYDSQMQFMQDQLKEKDKEANLSMKDIVNLLLEEPKKIYDVKTKKFSGGMIESYLIEKDMYLPGRQMERVRGLLNARLKMGSVKI